MNKTMFTLNKNINMKILGNVKKIKLLTDEKT
jgi:hypothetical protein